MYMKKKFLGVKVRQARMLIVCLVFAFIFSLPVSVLAATTVGNNVSVGDALAVTGATTLNGTVTLGDAVNDSITITGKLGTIYVSDGSTTSTHAKNSLTLGEASGSNLGKFYVDSSGNVNASGTLGVVSTVTLTGALVANGAVTLGNAGDDLVTLNGYFNTLTVGDLTTTSTLTKNSLTVAAAAASQLGKFYVDSSGNVTASGTLQLGVTNTSGTSTLWVGNMVGRIGLICIGDTDGTGGSCLSANNGTFAYFATSTY